MGEGKSRIALAVYLNLKPTAGMVCVIVCRRKAFDTWKDEIVKCGIDAYVTEDSHVSSRRLTFRLVSHAMIEKFLNEFKSSQIAFVIYDELYLYSNHKSQRSIAAQELTRAVDGRCIGLSGTIMPARDTLSIWGQTRAVGISSALARTTTDFYDRYKKCFLADYGRGEVRQWQDLPRAKERILEKLADSIHIHFPKSKRSIVESFTTVELTPQQLNAIKRLKAEYFLELEEAGFEMELKSALELIVKVSQIGNGWVQDKLGNAARFPSKKLDAVCALVEEAHATSEPLLVWCYFKKDIENIRDAAKIPVLEMSGGKEFDRNAWRSGNFPVVLATVGSGASVNDFKDVRRAIFFSNTFKQLDYSQACARTNRFDSAHSSCSYTHLFAAQTFDKHIYTSLKRSASVEQDFINRGIIKQWLNS